MKKTKILKTPTIPREEGDAMKNSDAKNTLLNPGVIFENKLLLEGIITRLQKFLKKKLKKRNGRYLCNGDQNLEHRWDKTLEFCEMEGIECHFVGKLIECLDYPDCEGDFVTDFTVEEVMKRVQEFDGPAQGQN